MLCCVTVPDNDNGFYDDYDDGDHDNYDYVNAEICRRNGSCTAVCTVRANVVGINKTPSVPQKVVHVFLRVGL
jgi:MinD superfamily P-loop ATPase